MLKKILFIGLGKIGEEVVHKLRPLVVNTRHSLVKITTQATLQDDDILSINLNLPGELSLSLICDNYHIIENQLNFDSDFVIFICDYSQACRPLAHLFRRKNLPYIFFLNSNDKRRLFTRDGIIANIQASEYGFTDKIIDLVSLCFEQYDDIDWHELELFLRDECYQEIMPININGDIDNEIAKIYTILELAKSSFNLFLLINCQDVSIDVKIAELITKMPNSILVHCSNLLIKGSKLSVCAIKKNTDDEIQLDLNLLLKNDEGIAEKVNIDDLSIPTFKRRGVIIDQGF